MEPHNPKPADYRSRHTDCLLVIVALGFAVPWVVGVVTIGWAGFKLMRGL